MIDKSALVFNYTNLSCDSLRKGQRQDGEREGQRRDGQRERDIDETDIQR